MLTAIEPKITAADGGIHEGAVMGPFRMRMGVRLKMAAGDAHALEWDCTGDLQLSNERNLGKQQLLLGSRRKLRQSVGDLRACLGNLGAESETVWRRTHERCPRVAGIGVAPNKPLADERTESVRNARSGNSQMCRNLLGAQTSGSAGKEYENLCLGRVEPGAACSCPEVGAEHEGNSVEALEQASDEGIWPRCVVHTYIM